MKKQPKPKQPTILLLHGHCGNPRCKAVWLVRVATPIRCPRCGSKNIYVE